MDMGLEPGLQLLQEWAIQHDFDVMRGDHGSWGFTEQILASRLRSGCPAISWPRPEWKMKYFCMLLVTKAPAKVHSAIVHSPLSLCHGSPQPLFL